MVDIKELLKKKKICFKNDISAKQLTSFRGGGVAEIVIYPKSTSEVKLIFEKTKGTKNLPFVLGKGSNTIIADGVIHRPLLSTENLNDIKFDGKTVYCGAGVPVQKLIAKAREKGLGGLEFLAGVPCSVGGALKMNAGAFGQQIGDFLLEIESINSKEEDKKLNFSYRNGADGIVLGAVLKLDKLGKTTALQRNKDYIEKRSIKQPMLPSCGCCFKNPNLSAGLLIEQCGLKGTRIGGAKISQVHANFIVNLGDATSRNFLDLIELCEATVLNNYSIMLEREFVLLENP